MCNCGCNTCETKGPLLTEGKVKSLLSEGLQYHIDKKIPLFETVYRIGSDKHLSLIREARKMYSRNVIDLCEEDEALIKTNLGEFALYEGVSIPLDLPMLNEKGADTAWTDEEGNKVTLQDILDMTKNIPQKEYPTEKLAKIVLNWDDNPEEIDRISQVEISKQYPILIMADESGKIQWILDGNHRAQKALRSKSETIPAKIIKPSNLDAKAKKVLLGIPMLNESYDYDEVAQSEFGMDYDQLGSGEKEWVRDEIDNMSMNESDSNYPDFDLNKNIRYQDTSISSGMWRYTGKEQGGKGVYRNLNNDQILAFDRNDFDIFRKNLSSHFDILESLNENKEKAITFRPGTLPDMELSTKILDKEGIKYRINNYDLILSDEDYLVVLDYLKGGNSVNVNLSSSILNEAEDKLLKIKQELEALRPGTISWIDDIFISSYDGSLQVELDYTLYPDEIKQLAQIAAKYGMELKYMTGKNATLVKRRIDEAIKKSLTEKKSKKTEKKDPPLNKPKRGGSKAYYVYVRDPKTKKIKKVSFGSGGLRAKIKNKKARNAFAARHNCKNKKDRTKAGYWSCNLPRYAPALGLGAKMNTFW